MKYLFSLIICFLSVYSVQAQDLHLWQTEDDKPQIRFSSDLSKMLVFTWDKITVWDTSNGELISTHSPFIQAENRWPSKEVQLKDADASLNELVFIDNNTNYRFLLFMNAFSAFPGKDKIRNISFFGYVNNNDMAIRYYQDMKLKLGILKQGGEIEEIKEKKHTHKSSYVTLDKKAIVLRDIQTYMVYSMEDKKLQKAPIKGMNFDFERLPDGWIEAYSSSRYELQFYNYLTKEKEFYKKNDGYTQFQPKAEKIPATINHKNLVRATARIVATLEELDTYASDDETFRAYAVKISDRNTGEEIQSIRFSESLDLFLDYRRKVEEAEMQNYKEFLVNFELLPTSYKFDYNSASGRDISSIPFVMQQKVPRLGDQMYALGKIMTCPDGGAVVLCMGFTQKGTRQTSKFAIFQFDGKGKLIDTKDLYATIRDASGVSQLTNFDVSTFNNFYKAHVKLESSTKAPKVSQYAGGCGEQ